jgi:hypothetical protein
MVDVLRNELEETEKRVDEKIALTFNFARYVAEFGGVSIVSFEGAGIFQASKGNVTSTPLTISGGTFQPNSIKAAAFFEGGTDLEDYDVWATVNTSDGQRLTVAGIIKVRDRK